MGCTLSPPRSEPRWPCGPYRSTGIVSVLIAARDAVAVMKLSGAVGTYSNIDPAGGARRGRRPRSCEAVPATQVIARDRHAEFLWACASVGATCELIAVELRHLQRTEVAEVQEGFRSGQKGSSAMPHKRNPISAETISGLVAGAALQSSSRTPRCCVMA
jgi:adenylosuccinate lyase